MQKSGLFLFKMVVVSWNLEELGQTLALHSGTTQDMFLQNFIGISVKLKVPDPEQRFEHTFRILLHFLRRRQQLQTYQIHILITLYVGPNKDCMN